MNSAPQFMQFRRHIDLLDLCKATALTVSIFSVLLLASQAYAAAVVLSVTVQTSITFTTTSVGFANAATNITPGTPLMATTSLSVTTNDTAGWNVTLSGDWKNSPSGQNLQLFSGGATTTITDQTEWVPGTATTTYGTGTSTIANLVNSGNVLAFRVAQATSTNGTAFFAPNWWGSADNYTNSSINTAYAGISSSTVQRQIGNAGAGSYSAAVHVNDVQYYLNVGSSQKTGAYTAPLTYTATGN